MLSSRFQRFTNYKNIYLLDTLEGLVMSPSHFRFYDEAPGTIVKKATVSISLVSVFHSNLYWSAEEGAQSAAVFPEEANWAEWQSSGNDTGSIWSQPIFRWPIKATV